LNPLPLPIGHRGDISTLGLILVGQPDRVPAPDLVIRAEHDRDAAETRRVIASAFGSPREAQLVEALRDSPSFVPEWSLVATLDETIVGHVLVTYATLRDEDAEHRVANLSPLSVEPERQRHGIGSALMGAVTRVVDAAREPLIILEGSPQYYERFGFEHAAPLGITIDLPDWAPAAAAQVLRLSRYDPAIRGHLVYPPAFDALER
jgi:putative acetyltransferase